MQSFKVEVLSLQDPLLHRSTHGEAGDVITHLQGPAFFWSQVSVSSETRLNSVLAPTFFFFEEATCESSTSNRLLYALEAL
jgi:hypothetical protein